MSLSEIALLLGLNLLLITVVMTLLTRLAVRWGDVSFIDGVWPLGMLLLALVTFPRTDGDPVRKGLILWLVAIWAIRLGWHLLKRWREHGAGRSLRRRHRSPTPRPRRRADCRRRRRR